MENYEEQRQAAMRDFMKAEALDLETLKWLTDVPAGDVNFVQHLKETNETTIRAAIERVPAGHKTKHKVLEARLRQLEKEEIAMAPRTKEPRAHDTEADAASQIYQVAQAEMQTKLMAMQDEIGAIREESQAMGALAAIEANIAYNELLRAVTLQRIKQSKEYKKGGLTWDGFCDALGQPRRTVDLMLEDLRPVIDSFSANFAGFCGMPFSKIRLLGKTLSANLAEIQDNCLVYGDESIPLTPEFRDDIQALVERISEDAKNKLDEAEANLSAKDKVLKSSQDLLNKQERQLRKYEKQAKELGLTPDEDAYLQQVDNLKMGFDGYLLRLEQLSTPDDFEAPSPRMSAALISGAHYMKMQILAVYDTVVTTHGNPVTNPELLEDFDRWQSQPQG